MTPPITRPKPPASGRRPPFRAGVIVLLVAVLASCAPSVRTTPPDRDLRPFTAEPVPREERPVIAVPDFAIRAGSVRIGGHDVAGRPEAEGFERNLGSGVSDIFATEAFRSGRFVVTERDQLVDVLREQDLGRSGRVDPESAAEAGRILGAEILVFGSVTEFGVTETGGGGRVFGLFGGSAETVTARVGVDVRLVDAVTAELLAIGVGTAEASQSNVRIDVFNIVRGLGAGRSGTTIIDLAVRNAIRAAIDEAAASLPARTATR